jgi:hypothetical protein
MVRKVAVSSIDDVDGQAADETVIFGLDGVSYEIELSTANAKRLRSELTVWATAGRRRWRPAPRLPLSRRYPGCACSDLLH